MRIIRRSKVMFINDKVEKEFNLLKEEESIKKHIKKAIEEIKLNAFCAIPIPKRLIPKQYNIGNLWKYDLPDGWRLMYTITTPNKIEIISIILEWLNHKDYERRFRY